MTYAPLPIAILGAAGRMGARLVAMIGADPSCTLAGAYVRAGSAAEGRDAGEALGLAPAGVVASADLGHALRQARVAIDFTPAGSACGHASACAAAGIALVVGSTGLSAEEDAALERAASTIALLQSANMSLGVHVLARLVREAAARLPSTFDVEVLDVHHRAKRDAPSGTALLLGEAARAGRGQGPVPGTRDHASSARFVSGGVGYASLRAGDVVGEHSVLFAGEGERLVLSHAATDRGVFAAGALAAARFVADRAPGRYTMADIVGV